MRLPVSRRTVVTTSILAAGVTLLAPSAQATPAPPVTEPVTTQTTVAPRWVDTAGAVDQANATLSPLGITLDRTAAEQFDATANAHIDAGITAGITAGVLPVDARISQATTPYATTADQTAQAPQAVIVETPLLAPAGTHVRPPLPNYTMRTDLPAQVMALTPGEVLHRVPGSWFNQPAVPVESQVTEDQGKSLFGPGTPIYLGQDSMCTLAVTGVDAEGRKIGITAGHCGDVGDAVRSADSFWVGEAGTIVADGSNDDYSVIEFGSNAEISNSYNGVTVNGIGGRTTNLQEVCKTGVATGFTCGLVWTADERLTMSQLCAMQGDSGAPVIANGRVVGLISGGLIANHDLSCRTPIQGPLHMPSLSVNMDRIVAEMDASGGPGRGFTLAGQ